MFFKLTNYRLIFTMVDVSVLCWYTNVALEATTKTSVVYDSMLLLTPMTVGWGGENQLIWAGLAWGWLYSTCPSSRPPPHPPRAGLGMFFLWWWKRYKSTSHSEQTRSTFQSSGCVIKLLTFCWPKKSCGQVHCQRAGKYMFAGRNCKVLWQRAWILRGVKNYGY